MFKKILLLFVCSCYLTTYAQQGATDAQKNDTIKYWKTSGSASFNFSQVSLTNWAGGGNSTVAGTFLFNGNLNYKKDKVAWDNTLDIGYGLTKQKDYNLAKTEDKFNFNTKLGYAASKYWYYSAMVDFKTQFSEGYEDPLEQVVKISDFMAPGYLESSLGMDYKPSDNFSLYLSPLTNKITFVLNDSLANAEAFGVDAGENIKSEMGASVMVVAKKENLVKNVNLSTTLKLFSSYTEKPENIDVDWNLSLDAKINSYLSAVFTTDLIYDDDINYTDGDGVEHGPRIQLKQLFGAGLAYTF